MPQPEKRFGQVNVRNAEQRLPRIPDSETIYLQETEEGHSTAVFRCPCGCGLRIELPLRPVRANEEAEWDATVHEDGTVTLKPEISTGPDRCCSTFSIERNEVRWQA